MGVVKVGALPICKRFNQTLLKLLGTMETEKQNRGDGVLILSQFKHIITLFMAPHGMHQPSLCLTNTCGSLLICELYI